MNNLSKDQIIEEYSKMLEKLSKEKEELTKSKENLVKTINKQMVNIISQDTYNLYDSKQQNINIKEKGTNEQFKKENMFHKFYEFIQKIDIEKNNNITNNSKFLDNNEINDIIIHTFGKNLEIDTFLEAFKKPIEKNVNVNWILSGRIKLKKSLETMLDKEIKDIFFGNIPEHIIQLKTDLLLSLVLSKEYDETNFDKNICMIKLKGYSKNP